MLVGDKLHAAHEHADNVVFSIDGPNAETHDAIRGKKGIFERVISNIHALVQLNQTTKKGPSIELDTTITRFNIALLAAMIPFSKQFGDILVDYDPAQVQSVGNSDDRKIIDISPQVVDTVFDELISKAEQGAHYLVERSRIIGRVGMIYGVKKYCIIGCPIKHSLSPKIFNAAFRKLKIPARYEAIEVKPENLAVFMRGFRGEYAGANVTIPHKEKILRFLDKLSPEAKKIGAVNVIVNKNGKLVGYNTDVFGAMEALRSGFKKTLRGKKAIVLGAGGAARAIVYGLKKAGTKITILNRTVSHAKKLALDFKCKFGFLEDFNPAQCDILINATSVGMWPQTKRTPFPRLKKILNGLKKKPIAMDIIYRPRMTQFLRDAVGAGCHIITGDKMFLAQAAKSFEIWTGKKI